VIKASKKCQGQAEKNRKREAQICQIKKGGGEEGNVGRGSWKNVMGRKTRTQGRNTRLSMGSHGGIRGGKKRRTPWGGGGIG